tara:strand:+ start:28 stop:255 length:228 start_codon:yes stop_codon:yes gene_type:complete
MNGRRKKRMNEAVITIKLTDSEVNLMVETLKNSTLNGEMKEPLKRLEDDLVDILDMVALKRRENKLIESREVTIG